MIGTLLMKRLSKFGNSYQKDVISQEELGRLTARLLEEKKVVADDHFSAAEVFAALVESLDRYHGNQELPLQYLKGKTLFDIESSYEFL